MLLTWGASQQSESALHRGQAQVASTTGSDSYICCHAAVRERLQTLRQLETHSRAAFAIEANKRRWLFVVPAVGFDSHRFQQTVAKYLAAAMELATMFQPLCRIG